jgi:hypothetical protein
MANKAIQRTRLSAGPLISGVSRRGYYREGAAVSIVADIVLLCDLSEAFTEDFQMLEHPPAVASLNAWLEEHEWAPLVLLSLTMSTEAAFQACAYGGALVRLDVPAFLQAVAVQSWTKRDAVLLALKNEGEKRFAVYCLGSDGAIAAVR